MATNNMNAALGFLHVTFGGVDGTEVERLYLFTRKKGFSQKKKPKKFEKSCKRLGNHLLDT